MNSLLILHYVLNTLALAMYLRSLFFLIRVWKYIKTTNLIIAFVGCLIMVYGIIEVYPVLIERRIYWTMGHTAMAYIVYIFTRHYNEKYHNVIEMLKNGLNFVENGMLKSFKGQDSEVITKEMLDSVEVGKVYSLNDKVQYEKVEDQDGSYHFVTLIKPGGKFSLHSHDCKEMCVPFIGSLHCPTKEGKQTFYKNEPVYFEAGEKHAPYATEFTMIRVYFY